MITNSNYKKSWLIILLICIFTMTSCFMTPIAYANEAQQVQSEDELVNANICVYDLNYIKKVVFTDTDGNEVIPNQNGSTFKPYILKDIKKGTYYYKTYKNPSKLTEENLTGQGSFNITENNQIVYLRVVEIKINSALVNEDIYQQGGSVILKDSKGDVIQPVNITKVTTGKKPYNGNCNYMYILPLMGKESPYYYEVSPTDDRLYIRDDNCGSFVLECNPRYPDTTKPVSAGIVNRLQLSLTLNPKVEVPFKITKGAEAGFYLKGRAHYVPFTEYMPTSVDTTSDEKYDIYTVNIPENVEIHMTAGGKDTGFLKTSKKAIKKADKIRIDGKEQDLPAVIDLEKLDNEKRVDDKLAESDLYLNVDDSNFLELNQGDSFDLEAFRVWQAGDTLASNYFIEPDFHYEVIGDSIELEKKGLPGREYVRIKAKEKGTSLIKVTYDAICWGGTIELSGSTTDVSYYNAIDPINTRVVIVSVDGDNAANIHTNIDQTEYDTIYYTKKTILPDNSMAQGDDHAEYIFKPTADEKINVRVHDPLHNTEWGTAWTEYKARKDGSYKLKLKEGRNIVEVSAGNSVQYYIINVKSLIVKIQNKTTPGQNLKVGETADVSFEGLALPVQKMAAVYNPGFPDKCWVEYETDSGRKLQSDGVQIVVREKNNIEFIVTEPGTINLVNGSIYTEHLGSELNSHRHIPKTGLLPNFSAVTGSNDPHFSTLPNIAIEVLDNETIGELSKFSYGQLNDIKLGILGKTEEDLNLNALNWKKLNAKRNCNFEYSDDKAAFFAEVEKPVNDDILTTYRTRAENEEWSPWKEVEYKTRTNLLENLPGDSSPDYSKTHYIEIKATPDYSDKAYTQTYTIRTNASKNNGYEPYLLNLEVIPSDSDNKLELTQGQVYAVDKNNNSLDLGYGFLSTENRFMTVLPYQVNSIKIIPTALIENSIVPEIKINNDIVESGENSNVLNLDVGENEITVKAKIGENTITYTLIAVREGEPNTISFDKAEEAKIVVKSPKGKSIKSNEDGTYSLPLGNGYTYIYSRDGYKTIKKEFDVLNDTTSIELPELEKLMQEDGIVSVKITGIDSNLRETISLSYDVNNIPDLSKQAYVEYSYGGYTALHALIEACDTGINKIKFSCYKGIFKPITSYNTKANDDNTGWICEVNGIACDPESTLLKDEDKVEFYYKPECEGMLHTWFKENFVNVKQGNNAELLLLGTQVNNDGTEPKGIEGATIKVNGKEISNSFTDENGKITVPSSMIGEPGQYTITAEKIKNGKNILTYCVALINVKKADVISDDGKMTVKFRLIGDAKHDGISEHGKYVTWIATKKMTFTGDSVSVYEVFTRALDEAGLEYIGADKNYVRKIKAPKAYGGYWLSEFTNGKNSGWMYTVNGEHPLYGLKDYRVTNGDVIIWHYVDDYKLETSFEGSKPVYPNRWLEAEDKNPPTDKIIDMSKGNKEKIEEVKETTAIAKFEVKAKLNSKGQAEASVSSKEMKDSLNKALEAIKDSKKKLKPEVVVEVKADSKAKSVITTIPTSSGKELAKEKGILSLNTPMGDLTFNTEALETMVSEAKGSDIKLSIEKVDTKKDKVISKIKELSDRPVFNLSATSKDKEITNFNKGKVTFYLPYTLGKNEKKEGLKITYINDEGVQAVLADSSYDEKKKVMKGVTNHFSYYAVTYSNASFDDVTSGKWFYESVMYLVDKGILKGKTERNFAPNDSITRAEFVAILARMSGQTMPDAGNNFTDVKATSWYSKNISWAVNAGIAKGVTENQFAPNAKISRQDMAVMITRYTDYMKKNLSDTNKEIKFTDSENVGNYAKDAVVKMQKAGIINGIKAADGSYSFAPKNNATRAETAKMIYQLAK